MDVMIVVAVVILVVSLILLVIGYCALGRSKVEDAKEDTAAVRLVTPIASTARRAVEEHDDDFEASSSIDHHLRASQKNMRRLVRKVTMVRRLGRPVAPIASTAVEKEEHRGTRIFLQMESHVESPIHSECRFT